MTIPEQAWSDERILNETFEHYQSGTGKVYESLKTVALRMRTDYEAERAIHLARIAELEAQLISVSSELVSTSNADRYYRGFNDGFAHAESRIAELERELVSRGEAGV